MGKKVLALLLVGSLLLMSISGIILLSYTALSEGYQFKENLKLNDATTGEQTNPAIASLGNNVYVVWEDERNGNKDIYFTNSSDAGHTFSPNIRVDDDPGTSAQTEPDIAVDRQGRVHIVWVDDREGMDHIYYTNSSDGGQTFKASRKIDQATKNERSVPSISVSTNGHIYVAWTDQRDDSVVKNRNIYFCRSVDNGTSFDTDLRPHAATPTVDQRDPSVSSYGDNVYIAWTDDSSSDKDVYMVSSSDNGQTFSIPMDVTSAYSSSNQEKATTDVDELGNVYLAWRDRRNVDNMDIYFALSTDSGASFGSHVLAVDSTSSCNEPELKVLNSSYCGLIWFDGRNGDDDIFFCNSTDMGSTWGVATRVDDTDRDASGTNDASYQTVPTVDLDSYGHALAAWADNRDGDRDIFFSRSFVSAPGVDSPPYTGSPQLLPGDGNTSTSFRFLITYFDDDGDTPTSGYPCLRLFNDSGATEELARSPVVMTPLTPADLDPTDGMIYFTDVSGLPDGSYWHRFEIRSKLLANVSEIFQGPFVDGYLPGILPTGPANESWFNTYPIACSMSAWDSGSGIDLSRIEYSTSVSGPDAFDRWYKVPVSSIQAGSGNRSVNVSLDSPTWKSFPSGDDNYIKWRVFDMEGNGPNESAITNIRFDEDTPGIKFYLASQYSTTNVTVFIDIDDSNGDVNASGFNVSSLLYSFTSNSSYDLDQGPWHPLGEGMNLTDGFISQNISLNLQAAEGGNYLEVRAADRVGNSVNSTTQFLVVLADNSAPTPPTKLTPSRTTDTTPRLGWKGATDPDGDELTTFIMIGTTSVEDYIIPWTSVGTDDFFNVITPLRIDFTYIIQLKVFDGELYSSANSFNISITSSGNTPPSEPTNILPTVTEDTTPTISWDPSSDVDNDTVMYMIQIVSLSTGQPVIPWQGVPDGTSFDVAFETPLTPGFYKIELQAFDGTDYSDPITSVLKVCQYVTGVSLNVPPVMNRTEVSVGSILLSNEGMFSDNVTLTLSGTLLDIISTITLNGEIQLTGNSSSTRFALERNRTLAIVVQFRFHTTASAGQYTLEATIVSESGDETSRSQTRLIDLKVGDNTTTPGIGKDGVSDGNGSGLFSPDKLAGYWWILLIFVVVVIFIVMIALFVSRRSSERRFREQKEEEARRSHKKLYTDTSNVEYVPGEGSRGDWGASASSPGLYDQHTPYSDPASSGIGMVGSVAPVIDIGGPSPVPERSTPPPQNIDLDYIPPPDLGGPGSVEQLPEDQPDRDIFGYGDVDDMDDVDEVDDVDDMDDVDEEDESYMNIDEL